MPLNEATVGPFSVRSELVMLKQISDGPCVRMPHPSSFMTQNRSSCFDNKMTPETPLQSYYKGKKTHRSWNNLPPEIIRCVTTEQTAMLAENTTTEPSPHSYSSMSSYRTIVPSLGTLLSSGILVSRIRRYAMHSTSRN